MWDSQQFGAVSRNAGAMDATGQPLLNAAFSDSDLNLVSKAVLSACDSLDGLADGIIDNFADCTTTLVDQQLSPLRCSGPKTAACLSGDQIVALEKVFTGAQNSQGQPLYADWPWDAGIGASIGGNGAMPLTNFGWRVWKLGVPVSSPSNTSINTGLGSVAIALLWETPPVVLATADAVAFTMRFNFDTEAPRIFATNETYVESGFGYMYASSTDLSDFHLRGSKIILYHGVSDPVFSLNDTIRWWNGVDAANGGMASSFVRLFPVPGMNHCGGGPATDQFDAFGAMISWVEDGIAPDRIVASATNPNWFGTDVTARTRPLCPYPKRAHYLGTGDINVASSFDCR